MTLNIKYYTKSLAHVKHAVITLSVESRFWKAFPSGYLRDEPERKLGALGRASKLTRKGTVINWTQGLLVISPLKMS